MSHWFEKCLTSSLLSTTHHTCKTLPQLDTRHSCQLCVLWGHGFIVQMGVKNWCGHVCHMLMLNLKTILIILLIAKEGPHLDDINALKVLIELYCWNYNWEKEKYCSLVMLKLVSLHPEMAVPHLRSFPSIAFQTVLVLVLLMMALFFFPDALSFYACPPGSWWCDVLMI